MPEFDTELVLSAFQSFNEASAHMETAYHRLAEQFRSLSKELEETNQTLRRTVREKDRIGSHLRAVLESLECGVLVSDRAGVLTHKNAAAGEILFDDVRGFDDCAGLAELSHRCPELEAPLDVDGPSSYEATVKCGTLEKSLNVERRGLIGPKGVAGVEEGGAVFVIRDLTELRALERQAQQMERFAAMGEMALELAHEIRNPLGGIRLHVSLLESEPGLSANGVDSVSQIQVGIRSLNNAVSNMLSFGRPQPPRRVPTNVRELVDEVRGFLEPLTRERDVHVLVDGEGSSEPMPLDPDQLRQVLMNLWLNALNAMPTGGKLMVGLRIVGSMLEMNFQDSGPGLAPEVRERVFDPFFTTDRRGTGLGLAVASSIIHQHGGTIRAESEPGCGATFLINLPVTEEACAVTH